MTTPERASRTDGTPVVTVEGGIKAGSVSHVYFDLEKRAVAGVTSRPGAFAKASWVGVEEIEVFGRDVVLVKSEASLTPLGTDDPIGCASLEDMKGMRVVTERGELLGTLEDLDVRDDDWSISELHLSNHKRLLVSGPDIEIGPDQIIVSLDRERVVVEAQKDQRGFVRRLFQVREA